ncbi:MAG TPA: LLM class flavin-dependent oxidoreductase [Terriglobales bacterium]|nr:LLM class flavin-dependent oxidoreductase [Terriglobales bacterium]
MTALRIAVELPSDGVTPGEFLADVQAYEAAGAHAVWLTAASLEPLTLMAAAAAVTARVRLVASPPAPGRWPPDLLASVTETLRHLSRDRVTTGVDGVVCDVDDAAEAVARVRSAQPAPDFELWVRVPAPAGRAAWRESLATCANLEATGVVVPHAPNLLDILRNPEEDDRSDLAIATG